MKYIRETQKSVDQAVADLTGTITAHKFGVLHVHNIYQTLNNKGVPFDHQVQVLEVCNPRQAAKVLTDDMDMNMALPCRVSVYEKDGKTLIGMINPSYMLKMMSESLVMAEVATEVESVLKSAIDEAV